MIKLSIIIYTMMVGGSLFAVNLTSEINKIKKVTVNNIVVKDILKRIVRNGVKVDWKKNKYGTVSLVASTDHIRNVIEFSQAKGKSDSFEVRQIFIDGDICLAGELTATIRCLKEFEISLDRPGVFRIIRYQTAARAELRKLQKLLVKAYKKYKVYPTCLKELNHRPFKNQRYAIGFIKHNILANKKVSKSCGKENDFYFSNKNKSVASLLKKYNKPSIGYSKANGFSLVGVQEVFVKGKFALDVIEVSESGKVKQLSKDLLSN